MSAATTSTSTTSTTSPAPGWGPPADLSPEDRREAAAQLDTIAAQLLNLARWSGFYPPIYDAYVSTAAALTDVEA
jgi:hypothetical protein